MLRAELRDFPTGKIAVNPVKESRIRTHFRREGVKKAGCLEQHIHALIDISNEYHRGSRGLFLFASGKGAGGHVVFHDLDAVFIFELDTGNLVKSNTVP